VTAATEPAVFLPWDTDFFGIRIGRVQATRLTPDSLAAILRWNEANRIRCLYFSADGSCGETLALAHGAGFQFVDMRVDLSLRIEAAATSAGSSANTRTATPDDLPLLEAIARKAHTDTRFFKDHRFPVTRAEALYAAWIRRDLGQHHVLVATTEERPETPLGYISCLVNAADKRGRIGLIAVSDSHQGRGLGRALVRAGLAWFRSAGCTQVDVATQAANIAAQRLYQSAGFRSHECSAWFHHWSQPT
jgi:ribosomal protein S18 acetylase RimI-like enzyme